MDRKYPPSHSIRTQMSSLRFKTAYRKIFLVGRRFSVPVPWDGDETPMLKFSYSLYNVVVILALTYKVVCATVAIKYHEKFEEAVYDCGTVLIFIAFGVLICIFYWIKRSHFEVLIEHIDSVTQTILESDLGSEDYFIELYKKNAKIINRIGVGFTVFSFASPVSFGLSGPITGLIMGTYRSRLPIQNTCPFEKPVPVAFELLVLSQILGLMYTSMQKLAHEWFMAATLKIQSSYFKYLSHALMNMSKEVLANENADMEQKLRRWIIVHQAAIRNANKLAYFFSPPIILYYVCIIAEVAGGIFYQLNATDVNPIQANIVGLYMLITLVYLYLLCHVAEEFTEEAEKIAFDIYNFPWYYVNTKLKKNVMMVVGMANQRINMDAYRSPFFRLNRECYQAFIVNVVSSYMAFNKINDIGD